MNLELIIKFEKEHPYKVAFVIALILFLIILFYSPPIEVTEDFSSLDDEIRILSVDTYRAPKRVVKKIISIDKGEFTADDDVKKASGTSLENSALDIDFLPNIPPPRVITRLRKLYPKIARDHNVEALVNLVLLIAPGGEVVKVSVIEVRVLKKLPPKLKLRISTSFARFAKKIYLGARFTPTVLDGKRIPVKMPQPLKFKLDE
ncbi:hypothetical protein ACFL20_13560 [Spirochaetota bacterium]